MTLFLELIWALCAIDHKKKHILIFDKGQMQRLDDTKLTAQALYSVNFSKSNRKFCFKPAL